MGLKRLLVLANSIKKDGRCVAGREITIEKPPRLLGWIRPVSGEGEGELFPQHMRTGRTNALEPLEVVDVPVLRNAENPAHPEDWVVSGEDWTLVKQYPPRAVLNMIESPDHLWLEDASRPDRVTSEYLLNAGTHRSICLIRVDKLRLRFWKEFNEHRGYTQKKTRAAFEYNGVEYDLSLTDPVATKRFCQTFPPVGAEPIETTLPMPNGSALCISLTPPFNGYQYKVVATILEIP